MEDEFIICEFYADVESIHYCPRESCLHGRGFKKEGLIKGLICQTDMGIINPIKVCDATPLDDALLSSDIKTNQLKIMDNILRL